MARLAKLAVALVAAGLLAACVGAATRDATATALDGVLDGAQRSDEDRAHDRYRHPRQTLLFFGVRPQMSVLELWPQPGWYASVLAPLLARHGHYYAAVGMPQDAAARAQLAAFRDKLNAHPDAYRRVTVVPFPDGADPVPPGTLDLVLSFDNLGALLGGDSAPQLLTSVFRMVKPGGALGVVEPRPTGAHALQAGQVSEEDAIARIEAVGFRLVAKSQMNESVGVAETDGPLPAGESHRFALKFVKPLRSARR